MAHLTLHQLIYITLALFSMLSLSCADMIITAYDYQRKFNKPLSLGECPYRQVAVPMPRNSSNIEEERCTLHKKGTKRSLSRVINVTHNTLITSPKGVVDSLGLCGGEAASYLGILYSGECVSVEIASRLSFGNRIVVRAFVGHYQTALDILDSTKEDVRPGMEPYYKNKYYVKIRSYGTLEIIFVQLRFFNTSQALVAGKVTSNDTTMSVYMEKIHALVGEPKSVTIISLSTAKQENYKIETEKEWSRALRYVKILELHIQETRKLVRNNEEVAPHLTYTLFPFIQVNITGKGRSHEDSSMWEKTSMLEIKLRQTFLMVKKLFRKCKPKKSKVCGRVKGLRRSLKRDQREIHRGRSNWVNLTEADKKSFIKRYSSQVETFANLAKRMAKAVRKMKRKEKRDRLKRKRNKNSLNQIPNRISSKTHRIRHMNNKLGRRRLKKFKGLY